MDKKNLMQDMVPRKKATGVGVVPVRKIAPKIEVASEGEKFFQKKAPLKPEKPKTIRWSFRTEAADGRRFRPSLKLIM